MTKLYIKSMDGFCWYVGTEPCRPERGTGFQLGRYLYAATAWGANENLEHARSYARGLVCSFNGYEIADYGMNQTYRGNL